MSYYKLIEEKFKNLKNKKEIIILAIESSCDETACSIIKEKKILSNIVASQIDIHKRFGGVVPEIASRNHIMTIQNVVEKALEEADYSIHEIDVIAVTCGAGLPGALLVGVSFAKALAYSAQKPLIAVNHIRGHIAINYLLNNELEFPYLALVISGGHTAIIKVETEIDFKVITETQDDACGECFDKVARVLGLEYPGGPNIEKLAKNGKYTIKFKEPMQEKEGCNFSFSGLKTQVINYVHKQEQNNQKYKKEDVAMSFQTTVANMMINNLKKALIENPNIKAIVLSGGVASNIFIRENIEKEFSKKYKIYYPPLKYCTDNAAMIASEALTLIRKNIAVPQDITLDAQSNLDIETIL